MQLSNSSQTTVNPWKERMQRLGKVLLISGAVLTTLGCIGLLIPIPICQAGGLALVGVGSTLTLAGLALLWISTDSEEDGSQRSHHHQPPPSNEQTPLLSNENTA